jgi:hypothetical protein
MPPLIDRERRGKFGLRVGLHGTPFVIVCGSVDTSPRKRGQPRPPRAGPTSRGGPLVHLRDAERRLAPRLGAAVHAHDTKPELVYAVAHDALRDCGPCHCSRECPRSDVPVVLRYRLSHLSIRASRVMRSPRNARQIAPGVRLSSRASRTLWMPRESSRVRISSISLGEY